ncbi:MAG: UDP-N-acetylglucosamine--N-acetylmuramyl-(pentapeptide) pyrophosphoryl-undecaprenol N-acetylglucosamine transferase [Candidatus Omnitrophica bacterium]|nr:UDP-N-acetylglucosamine--N-acetylmuramyl-(pentapeptide) pyrophosphoryl-undecaprenol N-acetylglucosamine transferase [Candidatus Omnitrophota bacterium]MBU1870292.1 UDP-N-acetylglucosamine--N-acetylmuramyl-(pentapeptide) pyrophosphoryl-undecaprenol N-acetylglucosamine transferase [Candidatus Omnitrophota bacterium]
MKILVVSGSSGGHIFPALSFLEAAKLKMPDAEALLVLPKKSLKSQICLDGFKVKYISTSEIGFNFSPQGFFSLFDFLKGFLESLFLMVEFRPDVVVGFGSIHSISLVMLAWLFRTKTLIHEQNVIPGRASGFLAKFADSVAVSFPQTRKYLDINPEKIVFSGNPIRSQLQKIDKKKALRFFGLDDDGFTLLVMGGSLGSSKINECFMSYLERPSQGKKIQVIHITGKKDFDCLAEKYKSIAANSKPFAFLKEMQYAYSACDLVICRSGAMSVSELIHFRLPAILVPYPYASAHQLENAKFLEARGSAVILKDSELNTQNLASVLSMLLKDSEKLESMRDHYDGVLVADANEILINQIT